MKFSEQWLREWVSPDVSTDDLSHRLTMAGLEVDAIEPVAGEFNKVVVGEVLTVEPHPDADRLRVCQVNVGDETVQIVCGASNVVMGMKVPAALVGAKLPGGMKIKKSKLRGEASHGMLCSAVELGLAEQADGLMPFAADAPVGLDVREYLNLDDVAIELGLTPNRGDCLSMLGLAREASVLYDMDSTQPDFKTIPASSDEIFNVQSQAPAECPHYTGRVLKNCNLAAETPLWMQERLRRGGIRSISPVVDVTNYVMLELGQPMHAFDLDKLQGGLWVRLAVRNETLILLDGNKIKLDTDTLVIADVRGPIALAGIMGGEHSGVGDETTNLFLESAYFNPLCIAGKARSFGLHTDSSHRFERGVDPALQVMALERATELLLDIVGGEAGPVIEHTSEKHLPERPAITLRAARVQRVLGLDVPADDIASMLQRLDMKVDVQSEEGVWIVTAPSFRFDIEIEADLIEEVGRIIGYDNLPTERPQAALSMGNLPEALVSLRRVRHRLVDRGYHEAINYSFVDPKEQQQYSPDVEAIALFNPIASDMGVMRTSLLPGLLKTLSYNINRQQDRVLLFELGVNYLKQDTDINEENTLGMLVYGNVFKEQWDVAQRSFDYYDIKADIEALLALGNNEGIRFEAIATPVLHPGQSAGIYRGEQQIGWVGALHPGISRNLDTTGPVFVAELNLTALQQGCIPAFEAVSRYPANRRDIAVVVDSTITSQSVSECIKNSAGEFLRNLELFDVYSGKGIDSGRKSLALGLTLQASSRTLTDEDVEAVMTRVITALREDIGGTLRE